MKATFGYILVLLIAAAACGCKEDLDWYHSTAQIGNGYGGGDPQQAENWCWAACISTTLNELIPDPQVYHPVTQPSLVGGLFGGLADNGTSADSMVRLIDGKNYVYRFPYGGMIVYTIHAELLPKIPTVQQLKPLKDDKHRRVILLLKHHAVILREIDYAEAGRHHATVESWKIYDPLPYEGDRRISAADAANDESDDHISGGIVVGLTRG